MIHVSDAYTQAEQDLVTRLVKENDVHSVIEIGSYQGCSAIMWAQFEQISKVTCIDPFEVPPGLDWAPPDRNYYPEFEHNLKEHGFWDSINVVKGYSWIVADGDERVPPEADLVYIDGDHSYAGCYNDIRLYRSKARKVLLGDDYRPQQYPGVVRAVNDFFGSHKSLRTQGRFWWVVFE